MTRRRKRVDPAVAAARVICHDAFDRLWETPPAYIYFLDEPERAVTRKALVEDLRRDAYAWLSAQIDVAIADIDACEDLDVLRRIWLACRDARRVGPLTVRRWIAERAPSIIALPDHAKEAA